MCTNKFQIIVDLEEEEGLINTYRYVVAEWNDKLGKWISCGIKGDGLSPRHAFEQGYRSYMEAVNEGRIKPNGN